MVTQGLPQLLPNARSEEAFVKTKNQAQHREDGQGHTGRLLNTMHWGRKHRHRPTANVCSSRASKGWLRLTGLSETWNT